MKDCLCFVNPHFRRHYVLRNSLRGESYEHQREVFKHLVVEAAKQVYDQVLVPESIQERMAEAAALIFDEYKYAA